MSKQQKPETDWESIFFGLVFLIFMLGLTVVAIIEAIKR